MEEEIFVSVTYFYYLCTRMWYTKGEREKGGRREMLYKAVYGYTKFGRERGGEGINDTCTI